MRFSLFLNHSALALSLSIATSMFSNAQARVYEYTFTDINGAQKSVPESAPYLKEGANKRGNSSRLTQSFHFFMFEPIFSPVNALNQPI